MKYKKNVTKVCICLALLMSVSTAVNADPTTDSLNQQKQQLENQKQKDNQNMQQNQLNADSAQKDINNINMQITTLDSKIGNLTRTISDTNSKIATKETDMQTAQKNLEKAEADYANSEALSSQRVRSMYKTGNQEYISILLSSTSFSDFLTKAYNIEAIVNSDNKIMKDLSDKKEKIKTSQDVLKRDKDQLLAYKKDNESKLADVKKNMQSQQQLIAEAKNKQAYYMSQISDYKNKIAATDKQVQDTVNQLQALAIANAAKAKQQQINNSNKNSVVVTSNGKPTQSSANSSKVSPEAIVAYAYNFLGDPYVWGAEGNPFTQADIDMYSGTDHDISSMKKLLGRQAFDCSGLTQYVYAHFGIHIDRTTYDQINNGTAVDRSNLKLGDLIFFGTYSDPHHVGMYVGNNCYIQAPYSGDVVKVSSLDDTNEYLCARRILN
ncbi:C40 family peptidase [Clostridium sp. 19966]|uniref:C40 family peptidase n=1 Tax=Clostridium sp. 19966 TaxID=2768166 RepID=UPI0028DF0C0D|nr:NlpC/P60 family protein [Clostridium sp. 19966]MDT8717532.1 C40 family peptidase [Clostridium sp. 19966]